MPVKAADGNLLKNPSFEDGAVGTLCYSLSDWTFAANKVETGVTWSSDVSADTYMRDNVNFACRPLDGNYRLRLRGLGSASQQVSLDEAKYAATPEIPETASVKVAEGARLELDFAGTNRITKLWLGGVRVRSGLVSQASQPRLLVFPI